jgi:hypothetical protein
MKIRICHHDTTGLRNDAKILKQALEKCKMNVGVLEYPEIAYVRELKVIDDEVDVNIFLEHIHSKITNYAKINVFIPNPEWMNAKDTFLAQNVDYILCKTHHCFTQLEKYFRKKCMYLGFTSIDRCNERLNSSKNFEKCLHVKGISKYKNSQLLLDTWLKHPEWPTLYIVSYGIPNSNGFLNIPTPVKIKENIVMYQTFLSNESLENIMNLCGIHVCCSFSEGFGHYINEARSTRSLVITTNGSPMNEFVNQDECLVEYVEKKEIMHSFGYKIDENSLQKTLSDVFTLSYERKMGIAEQNRRLFEKERESFELSVQKFVKLIYKENK